MTELSHHTILRSAYTSLKGRGTAGNRCYVMALPDWVVWETPVSQPPSKCGAVYRALFAESQFFRGSTIVLPIDWSNGRGLNARTISLAFGHYKPDCYVVSVPIYQPEGELACTLLIMETGYVANFMQRAFEQLPPKVMDRLKQCTREYYGYSGTTDLSVNDILTYIGNYGHCPGGSGTITPLLTQITSVLKDQLVYLGIDIGASTAVTKIFGTNFMKLANKASKLLAVRRNAVHQQETHRAATTQAIIDQAAGGQATAPKRKAPRRNTTITYNPPPPTPRPMDVGPGGGNTTTTNFTTWALNADIEQIMQNLPRAFGGRLAVDEEIGF
jgi:hypothetical protein